MAKTLSDITLADLLPSSIAADKTVEQTAAAIDPELQDAVNIANHLPFYSQIDRLSGEWVDQLAWQWHADAYEQAGTLEERRYMAQNALLLHRWKGTPWAVKTALKTLGFQYVEIKEHWQLNSPPYTFAVRAGPMTENYIDFARRLIFEYKPTRSQLLWIDFSFWLIDEEQPEESFVSGIGVQPKETEAAAESVSPALSPDINESVWPRARYSDPGLYYDGTAYYDAQAVFVERAILLPYLTPIEQETVTEVPAAAHQPLLGDNAAVHEAFSPKHSACPADSVTVIETSQTKHAPALRETVQPTDAALSKLIIIV